MRNGFRKLTALPCFLLALAFCPSCTKDLASGELDYSKPITIGVEGLELEMELGTKATVVSDLKSKTVYWGTTTGGAANGSSNETAKWSAASVTSASDGKISTGKYQTATPTAYNYYVSNASFTIGAATTMTVANNNTDIVAGRLYGSNSATPSVTCGHIFARTGSLTLSPSAGSASSVTWKIKSKGSVSGTAGTYNLRTGAWTAASTTLSEVTFTGSSDLYLIPGDYTVTVSFTHTHGDYTNTFTKSKDITLVKGAINNITASYTDPAQAIVISTSVSAWTTNPISYTITLP